MPDGPAVLSAYAFQSRVWVRINDTLFACYRAGPTQKYPYIYPIVGPASGLPMTDESGVPWPHHRSCFLACDHVNGGNYWQGQVERGQIVSRGPKIESDGPGRVVIADQCDWLRPGQTAIVQDNRRFVLTVAKEGQRIIDVDIELTAKVDVRVTKTNHSLFAIRAARALAPIGGGKLVNANGQDGEKATFGKVARWCGYQGTRLGVTEVIVLMDHPGNPWSPCPWFTRDYGFISPTPFNWLEDEGWGLAGGGSIRLRYRVVAAQGTIHSSGIEALYDAFATPA